MVWYDAVLAAIQRKCSCFVRSEAKFEQFDEFLAKYSNYQLIEIAKYQCKDSNEGAGCKPVP